jgi:hypothetical protein
MKFVICGAALTTAGDLMEQLDLIVLAVVVKSKLKGGKNANYAGSDGTISRSFTGNL